MFPRTYFAGTYFAPLYWPSAAGGPPPPPVGDTFIFTRRSAKRLRDRTKRGCRVIR